MSTFCVTGDRKNVDTAVAMLKRLIAEGNSEVLAANANVNANGNVNANNGIVNAGIANGNIINGNIANGNIINGNNMDRRGPGGGVGIRGPGGDMGYGLGRLGSDGSPPTAPCR